MHASSRKNTVLQNISIPKIVNTHVCWVSKRSYQSLYCLYVVTGQWVQTFCMYCGCFSLPSFFLAHCYYFDTVLLYLNINVICHTEELKQCDVLCKSDIHYTWVFFYIYNCNFLSPFSINDNFLYLTWCGVRVIFWIKEIMVRKWNITRKT